MNENQILSSLAKLIANSSTDTKTQTSLQLAFDNFINFTSQRCRPDTVTFYKKHFKYLEDYFLNNNIFFIEEIDIPSMNRLVAYLKNIRKLKNNTINKFLTCLKSIVKYNYEIEVCNTNTILKFKNLPKDDIEVETIEIKNIKKILNYLNTMDLNNELNLRNVLLIHILKDTGARINEAMNIEIKNIDVNNNTIRLTFTKTKKIRYVYFSNETKKLLKLQIELIRSKNIIDNDFLFINYKQNTKLSRKTIYDFFYFLQDRLNIEQSISPHKWRHTLATTLVESCNLETVRRVLGHASLEMTKRYLHLSEDKIKKDVLNVLN